MTPEETHDHEGVICPYCGYKDRDSWELGDDGGEGSGETDCGSCERTFIWSRHISISYTGKPMKEETK
jgi:hypothetical protein